MGFDVAIPFSRAIRSVAVMDHDAPLPTLPARSFGLEASPISKMESPNPHARLELDRREREDSEAIRRTLAALAQTNLEMAAQYRRELNEMQRVAVELAVSIAERLIHHKIESGEFGIQSLVHQAAAQLDSTQLLTIRLHPEDLALLQRRVGETSLFADERSISLRADPSLARGDCRAEAGDVSIVSSLKSQLTEIRERLLRSVDHAKPQS